MTNLILLIGSGLFSKSIGNFQGYEFNKLSVCLPVRTCHSVLWTLTAASSYVLGWALMLTMLVVTGRAHTMSVEMSGTLTAATPKTKRIVKDG